MIGIKIISKFVQKKTMSEWNNVLQNLKQLSLENLTNEELNTLKNEIIKLLVDIQMQLDINEKMDTVQLSTDDIQLEIMEKYKQKEDKTTNVNNKEGIPENDNNTNKESEIHSIIKEEISADIISIYIDNTKNEQKEKTEEIKKENKEQKLFVKNNILFSINDKFRMIRKLFANNNKEFDIFLNELNAANEYAKSVEIIRAYAKKRGWEENKYEYQILVKQNQKRFKQH